ncbi:MAG: SGNH/GDSL hydrolase family protein [Candidatus Eisenbacteria bacterium]
MAARLAACARAPGAGAGARGARRLSTTPPRDDAWARSLASLEAARAARHPATIRRYVAIGDSSTEGLMDRRSAAEGGGFRGWSERLAERLAQREPGLLYANLAVRGLTTREIREQQLERALAMNPELATVFCGTNDVLSARFDVQAFTTDVHAMQGALRAQGATVLTFTLPDLTPLLPLARLIAPRIELMNAAVRAVCGLTGTLLVDFAQYPVTTDERLWDPDRIHANPAGHARIADALAEALALPGSSAAWREPLPPRAVSPLASVAREAFWSARYLLPWCALGLLPRRTNTRSPGKRPELTPWRSEARG